MATTDQAIKGAAQFASAARAAGVTLPRAHAIDTGRIRALLAQGNLALEIYDGEMPTHGRWRPRHWNARLLSVPMLALPEGEGYRFKRDGADDWQMVERTGIAQWCRLMSGSEILFGMPCYVAGTRSPGHEWGLELERLRLDAREHLNWWLVLEVFDDAELVELLRTYGTPRAVANQAPRPVEVPPPIGILATWRALPSHARAAVFGLGVLFGVAVVILAQGLAEALGRAGY